MLPMPWVQGLLKGKGRIAILTKVACGFRAWGGSFHLLLQALFQDALQKSKPHFRGARHPCGGADGRLVLGKVPKGSGGRKRAGSLKRKPHRWLHSCHRQIKAHDESCHSKKIFGMERSPLMVRGHCASLRMTMTKSALAPPNASNDVESGQCSLSLVGGTVGNWKAVSHKTQHNPTS